MDLQKGDEVWVFDGNILNTGEIIEPVYMGYRFQYTSGYARNGDTDVTIRERLFKIPDERPELLSALDRQADFILRTYQNIESGAIL